MIRNAKPIDPKQLLVESVLMRCGVPERYWDQYLDMVYYGIPRTVGAQNCRGASAAVAMLLVELSKDCRHKFPPGDGRGADRSRRGPALAPRAFAG